MKIGFKTKTRVKGSPSAYFNIYWPNSQNSKFFSMFCRCSALACANKACNLDQCGRNVITGRVLGGGGGL